MPTYSSATRLLPAPGIPMTSTTSAASRRVARGGAERARRSASALALARRRARASRRARPSARSPAGARPGSRRRSARGRAATRARPRPASRRAPPRPRRAPRRRARPPARRGPPSGECAISARPRSAQRSTTPPRSARSSNDAQGDLDRGDRSELERLVELAAVHVRERRRATRGRRRRAARARAPTSATASAGRARGGGRGRSGARRAPRGSPRSPRGSPSRGRRGPRPRPVASCRPSSRSARVRRRRTPQRAGEQPLVVAELSVRPYARAVSNTVMPGADRGRDRRERSLLVPVGVGREPHAAEPDPQLAGAGPGRHRHIAVDCLIVPVFRSCGKYPLGV